MKDAVHVALVQMATEWLNPLQNRKKILSHITAVCEQAPTDLIVFPELATTGYIVGRDADFNEKFIEAAEKIPGATTEAVAREAQKHKVHVVFGMARLHPVIPATLYNAAVLIDSEGRLKGVHHKWHIPAEEIHYFYPGNTTEVYETELGVIGMMVCYDSEMPELPRTFALKGAEIMVGIYNWGWPRGTYGPGRLSRMAAVRALENQVFFLACGKVGAEGAKSFYGNSTIAGPNGELIYEDKPEHPEGEKVIRATLQRKDLIRIRGFATPFRNRRPELYGELTKPF
jgi:predicted amidohydrolase